MVIASHGNPQPTSVALKFLNQDSPQTLDAKRNISFPPLCKASPKRMRTPHGGLELHLSRPPST